LIRFDSQESTDTFFQHFRGKQFNSLDVWFCLSQPMSDVYLR
jgi:BRCA1-associated protein